MTSPPVGQLSPSPASEHRESAQGAVGHRIVAVLVAVLTFFEAHLAAVGGSGHVLQQHRHLRADQPERHLRRPPDLPRHAERLQDPPGPPPEPSGSEAPVPARPHLHLFLPHPDDAPLHRRDEHHDDEHQILDRGQGGRGPHRRHRDRQGAPGGGGPGPFPGRRERRRRAVGLGRPRLLPAGSEIGTEPGAPPIPPCFSSRRTPKSPCDGELPPAVRAEVLTRIKAMKGGGDAKGTLIGNEFAAAWRRTPGGVIVVAVRPLVPAEASADPRDHHGVRRVPPGAAPG